MIIKSNSFYKNYVRKMWDEAFYQDSEEFRNFYFDRKYSHDNTYIYIENSKPVSSLQNLNYNLNFQGESFNISYISGACTFKSFRKKGYMSQLIKKTFRDNYKNNIVFSSLIPATSELFGYYEKFGYKIASYIDKNIFECNNTSINECEIIKDYDEFYNIYKKNIFEFGIYLNSKNLVDYYKYIENEKGFIICKGDDLAMVLPEDDIYLVEFSTIDVDILKKSLNKNFKLIKSGASIPLGMLRITNIKVFLNMIKNFVRENIKIKISDDIVLDNNICFYKEKDKLIFDNSDCNFEISISDLLFNFLNGISDDGFEFSVKKNLKMYMMMN